MKMPSQHYTQDLRRYYRLPSVQVSLTLVLSIFVVSIFMAFALRPTIISMTNLKKEIVESEKTLKQLDAKVVALQKASTQLDALKPLLPALNESIPNTSANYPSLTSAVEALAVQTGIQIESESLGSTLLFSRILSPFAPNKNQKVVELPFSIRVTGSYEGVAEFLSQLLQMQRIIMVESVTMSRENTAKGEASVVALNIGGSAYYLAEEAQLKKALEVKKGVR